MEITRKLGDMTVTIGLTATELEMAFRARQHEYRMEDAERYCDTFCDINNINPDVLFANEAEATGFYDIAAGLFGEKAEEGRKNNEVWSEVIEHCVTKQLLPGWKTALIDMAITNNDVMTDMLDFIAQELGTVPQQVRPSTNSEKTLLLSLLGPMELYPALSVVKKFIWKEN